jgi:hypothetical protein
MTIPSSSVPGARRWLFTSLVASLTEDQDLTLPDGYVGDGSASLLVCLDEPGPYQPADIVVVGKVERDPEITGMVGGGGAGWITEKYSIEIRIEVARGGDDALSAFERACDLLVQVETVVRTDPTMGGNVLWGRPGHSTIEVVSVQGTGRVGIVETTVQCTQRI